MIKGRLVGKAVRREEMITIRIASQFSSTPGGRFRSMGPASGEEFREKLVQALSRDHDVKVILDGTEGYGSSFLEEAFGGLIRLKRFPADEVMRNLHIIAETPEYESYAQEAKFYMLEAKQHLRDV